MALLKQKVEQIRKSASRLRGEERVATREVARLLGLMVAAHPAVLPAPVYYCCLQREKIRAVHQQGYNSMTPLMPQIRKKLSWWIDYLNKHNSSSLQISRWDLTIETDALTHGWGGSCQGTNTRGPWTRRDKEHHINYLELLAAFLALKVFARKVTSKAILLRMDNVTTIAYVNKMGGTHSSAMSDLAIEIWKWCIEKSIRIHAQHLPGKENVLADWQSRYCRDSSNWKLDEEVFARLNQIMG